MPTYQDVAAYACACLQSHGHSVREVIISEPTNLPLDPHAPANMLPEVTAHVILNYAKDGGI
jgi:hypothetical protein